MNQLMKERSPKADTTSRGSATQDHILWCQLLRTDGNVIDKKAKKFLRCLKYRSNEVEEISQNVLIKLNRTLQPAPLTWSGRDAYIWVTCLSCAADWLQKQRSERDKKTKLGLVSPPSETPVDETFKKERRLAIQTALATLTPLNRQIVILRYFEFMSVPKIAKTLQLPSTGVVEQRLLRSLHKLSQQKCLVPFFPRSPSR